MEAHWIVSYIESALEGFLVDPPDSDFQRGYLSCLLEMAKHAGLREDVHPYKCAREVLDATRGKTSTAH